MARGQPLPPPFRAAFGMPSIDAERERTDNAGHCIPTTVREDHLTESPSFRAVQVLPCKADTLRARASGS